MTWAISDMEDLVENGSRLAVAFADSGEAQRRVHLPDRKLVDNIEQRLARSLIRFSERLGTPEEDGAVRMMPFTHTLLSKYVGTSRKL